MKRENFLKHEETLEKLMLKSVVGFAPTSWVALLI
nr:MAG TPA: hypothetical protein [Caudoviricetes sp.]